MLSRVRTNRGSRGRRILRWISIGALLGLLAAEIGARYMTKQEVGRIDSIGAVALLPYRLDPARSEIGPRPTAERPYLVEDAELGWSLAPDGRAGNATTNIQGARGGPISGYAAAVPPGKARILSFGDSFVHCDEVGDAETWQAQLEALRTDLEVVNFGVPGYGTDQAFLRWRRESKTLRSTISILAIWPEDICRNLNQNRLYLALHGGAQAKPRFALRGTELVELPCAFASFEQAARASTGIDARRWFAEDHWWREREQEERIWYSSRLVRLGASMLAARARREERLAMYRGRDPRANEITVAICRRFRDEALALGTQPVVLLIPMRDLLPEFPGGERALPLVQQLAEASVEVWDLSPVFASAKDLDALNPPRAHMTRAGNAAIAAWLAEKVARRG